MKPQIIFLLAFIIIGCAANQQTESPSQQPELISMTSLPSIAPTSSTIGLKLNVLFHVKGDGWVTEVKLLGSSGDPEWDRAAVDSMKQWRFTANHFDSLSAGQWIRSMIVLQVQEPTVLTLGEMSVDTPQAADSLYALIQTGTEFEVLSKQVAPGASTPIGKFLGAVDIARYPKHVRDSLRRLGMNDCTHPIRIGSKFTIFKRYKPDGTLDLPQ